MTEKFENEKRAEQFVKAHFRDIMFEELPPNFPSMRNLKIQNEKLLRMIRSEKDSGTMLVARSIKKSRKEVGQRAARIGQQIRKVDHLFEKACKEFFRAKQPKMTNAWIQEWKAGFNKTFDARVRETKALAAKEITKMKTTGEFPPHK